MIVENCHWRIRVLPKKFPVNLPPAGVGFRGLRSGPTGIVILSFIDHQGVEPRIDKLIAQDIAHQTRNDVAEVKFALLRTHRIVPSDASGIQQLASQAFPALHGHFGFSQLSPPDQG